MEIPDPFSMLVDKDGDLRLIVLYGRQAYKEANPPRSQLGIGDFLDKWIKSRSYPDKAI